jgi:excinuclease ABC subunit A
VIKQADWIVDLGPEGGDKGGKLVFQGTPEALVAHGRGHTARHLRRILPRAQGATA